MVQTEMIEDAFEILDFPVNESQNRRNKQITDQNAEDTKLNLERKADLLTTAFQTIISARQPDTAKEDIYQNTH